MAIKGKSRTKSKPRPVARAPRHEPVVVKPPLLVRRWVQVTAALVVGAFAAVVVVWATNGLRKDSHDKAAASAAQSTGATKRAAGLAWQSTVEGAMNQIGTLNAPLPPDLFKTMNHDIDVMKKQGTAPGDALKVFAAAVTSAKKAIGDLTNFDLTSTISGKGFDVGGAEYFTESKDRLNSAIKTYQRAAEAAIRAVHATGAEHTNLTTLADNLRSDANTEFQTAWGIYQSAIGAAGIATTPTGAGSG